MVYPVGDLIFKINTQGTALPGDFKTVADMETFELSFDNGIEEWTPMGAEGWVSRLMTAKSITVGLNGKRNYGDAGNDYIASKNMANGHDADSVLQIVFPNSDTIDIPCVINVTALGGGDSTSVGALEFETLSNGKPEYTDGDGKLAALTFVCSEGGASGTTKIAAISPVLTGGNSYFYKINGGLPEFGKPITGKGFSEYTLGEDIATANGNNITIVEAVTATKVAQKGGIAAALTD